MSPSSDTHGSAPRLGSYVETLTRALGHADRASSFRSYCTGLLLPGARKSVEPMAARLEPVVLLHHAQGHDQSSVL